MKRNFSGELSIGSGSAMPNFADSFWSEDLASGLQVLFEKLHGGCEECDMFIQLFASRMQFEVNHGRQLGGISSGVDNLERIKDNAEASSVRALVGMADQMVQEGKQHLAIAANIEALVLQPFSHWCDDHRKRLEYSEKTLMSNVANYQKSKKYVSKLESEYFNRCRQLEDFKRSNFNQDELANAVASLKLQEKFESDLAREMDYQHFATVGGMEFDLKSMREALALVLKQLPKSEYKVPLINYTLQNTNSGGEITKFLLEHMSLKDIDQAENFGQDLLNMGFLKYCNGVGNSFVNSKKFQYQWKGYAYKFARVPQPFGESDVNIPQMDPKISHYLQDFTSKMSSASPKAALPNSSMIGPTLSDAERELFKLRKEVEVADEKYRRECFKMDNLRCSVEELMVDHLSFMEKCEADRLKAIKKVTFDFCGAIGNKISSLKISVDAMLESDNQMDPAADLLNLLFQYRTGVFQPRVITYNNYYNPGAFQNFGIDLETRCRLDKKVVPLIASVILSYMDQVYPELPSDKVRTAIWTAPVKLSLTHQLRSLLNERQFHSDTEVLEVIKNYNGEPSTVASVLKIYLLELPERLITNEIYDVLKVLYAEYSFTPKSSGDEAPADEVDGQQDDETLTKNQAEVDQDRITGLATTLSTLPKPHIATLDAIIAHFYRLIKILKMGDGGEELATEFTSAISQEFANCIIEVHMPDGNDLGYKILYDLLSHRKKVFGELKRQGSKNKKESSSTP